MAENKKETIDAVEEINTTVDPIDPADKTDVDVTKTEEPLDSPASGKESDPDSPEEGDSALESFLSREQDEKKPTGSPHSRKPLFILIGAVAAVVILVGLLIFLRSRPLKTADEILEAELSLNISGDGVHEADIALDEDGNIQQNGEGSLLTYVPSGIKQIDVENQNGSFTVTAETPSGEATIYKIVGLEDYPLQEEVADEIAKHSAELNFTRIIETNANLADFGLEKPRATVNVTYTDDTSSIIRVGDEAAGEAGTYVAFGTAKDVYLVNSKDVANFLYNVNEFISLTITDTNEDSDNAEFSKATITGTHFDDPIVLVPNDDEAIAASYLMTEPLEMPANAIEAGDIAGNIRGLYAEAVKCVNPSADQLSSYGLSEPYAQIDATYPDTEITLQCSSPNDDGTVYIYNPEKNVIYTIQLATVCWAKTNVDLLLPENPLNADLKYVSGISFTAGDTDFTLDVKTTIEESTDDDGNEQESSTSTATYNGKELSTENFNIFFQNIAAIKNLGSTEDSGKDQVMTVTLNYTTDRADDTLTVYSGGDGSKYIMVFNGKTIGTVSKTYINSLIEGADDLITGNPVEGL